METDHEVLEKASATLTESSSLYLSTSSDDHPWVAGAYFAVTDPFTLTVILEGQGRTLHNLQANSRFGIVISTGSPFDLFMQADGHARIVQDASELDLVKHALMAKTPQSSGFLGAPIPMTAVELCIDEWRVTDVMNGWLPARRLRAPDRLH